MVNFIKNWFLSRGYKKDKPMHFWRLGVYPSIVIFLICFFHFFRYETDRLLYTELVIFGISLFIAFGKETLDYWQRNKITGKKFDIVDAFATLAGATFVIIVSSLIVLSVSVIS